MLWKQSDAVRVKIVRTVHFTLSPYLMKNFIFLLKLPENRQNSVRSWLVEISAQRKSPSRLNLSWFTAVGLRLANGTFTQVAGFLTDTSADNVTLLAFAAERRAAGCPAAAAVDRYLLPAGRPAANPPHASAVVDRTDKRTDAVPLQIPCHRPR